MYKWLFKSLHMILLGLCSGVELLGPVIIPHLIFWGTTILSSIAAASFCTPISCVQDFHFSIYTCQHLLFSVFCFFLIAILRHPIPRPTWSSTSANKLVDWELSLPFERCRNWGSPKRQNQNLNPGLSLSPSPSPLQGKDESKGIGSHCRFSNRVN